MSRRGAQTAASVLLAAPGCVLAALSLYQLLLALAALLPRASAPAGRRGAAHPAGRARRRPTTRRRWSRAACARSSRRRTRRELVEVVVVADNCSDETAALARAAGATVLERTEPEARGKGRALRWATDRLLSAPETPHAVVVVDADSVAEPTFLAALAARFEAGAQAVQGESLLVEDGSSASALRAAAFLLVNRVRPGGREALGLPSNLAGNGMLIATDVLRAHPWNAFSSAEDVEFSMELRLAGVRPRFAPRAIVRSPTAPSAAAAAEQQLRWEGGKLHVARTRIPRLVTAAARRRDPTLLDAALELALPPLGLLTAAALAGTATSAAAARARLLPAWPAVPWRVALAGVPLYVGIGLRAAEAPPSAWRALAHAPLYVAGKAARAHRLLGFRADTWVRTERAPV